ncbi:MAG TPA: hypothetical protein VLA42_12175, partial [Verrucomicrobiae bacterium]|nr:hypothetical protein [Verrucomicrobiae bacterium]
AAVEGILAAGEDLGLKSPSAGRHLSVKSWGCGGKAPVRFPLKNRNSLFFQRAASRLSNSSVLFCNRYGSVYDLAVANLKNIVNGIQSPSVKPLLMEN